MSPMIDVLEDIERADLISLHEAADEALKERLGLALHEIGGALVSVAGRLPPSAIVVNRTLGLGLSGPATREDVAAIAAIYREAGVERFFVHLHSKAQPADLPAWFAEQGWQKVRGWMKFTRGTEPPPERETDLAIREIGPELGLAFGRIAASAFDLGEEAAPWIAGLAGRPDWRLFMTFAGDEPAGTGALYFRDGFAWCDFGATAPAFRRRGGQGALLAHRIREAIAMGCSRIVTATGEEVPGDPQHSYSNIMRMGFKETYVRENYAPPKR
jgi:GNAT superfamily N-acetyltransferase